MSSSLQLFPDSVVSTNGTWLKPTTMCTLGQELRFTHTHRCSHTHIHRCSHTHTLGHTFTHTLALMQLACSYAVIQGGKLNASKNSTPMAPPTSSLLLSSSLSAVWGLFSWWTVKPLSWSFPHLPINTDITIPCSYPLLNSFPPSLHSDISILCP